jgi:hypothetical protein
MTAPSDPLAIAPALTEPLRRAIAGERADWPALTMPDVDTLVAHGVAPLVYATARLPELRNEALRAAAGEPLRLADLREVVDALAARSVKALLIKGSALAYDIYCESYKDLYGQPELRPRGDTDILVAREAFPAAREALLALGCSERLTSGDEHAVRQQGFAHVDRYGVTHVYDVHWAVANSPLFAELIRIDEIEPLPLPRIGEHASTLPRVEALLLACVHRIAHHHDDERLIWLVDIALLRTSMSEVEHRRFWRLAVARGVVGICTRSIELAEEWFGGERLNRAEQYLAEAELMQDEPSRVFLDRRLTYGRETLANLRALSWGERLTRLRQLAFPPAAFMRQSFTMRSRAALPWLYVYRGARGVARLMRSVGHDRVGPNPRGRGKRNK